MKKYYFMVLAFISTLIINALANILPFNGLTTAEVALKFPSYFVPQNYVFSIWGVIYLALAVMVITLGLNQKKYKSYINEVAVWFVIANIFNSLWLITFHYLYIGLSVLLIGILLGSLIQMYFITEKYRSKFNWSINFAPSIYLGWVSVATVANISAYLAFKNYNLILPDLFYAVLMMYVALILGLLMVKAEKDYTFAAVILWAISGIVVKFSNVEVIFTAGLIGLAIYSLLVILSLGKKKLL